MNTFDRAGAPVGVLVCGRYKKDRNQAQLAVLDRGIGISESVRRFFKQEQRRPPPGDDAMQWAFESGTTTRPGPIARDNGLCLLTELLARYDEFMEVRSNDARVVF